jgi:YD repeat-containing protein
MNPYRKHSRIIATFFLLIFFPTLVPTNLFASNNGPKAPEAASFEPVDATDMVNLITGQYSYVLPLLNVPSPEGGYPIALGYHAGIAMDQEASWAGLGWNVNPGAIDRSINGYPDDYNASHLNEYFWDEGFSESFYSASINYSNGNVSAGVGFNWGSNQALSGSVSIGVTGLGSIDYSERDGLNYSLDVLTVKYAGLSVGVEYSSRDKWSANAKVSYTSNNGTGYSIGYDSASGKTSIGIDVSTGSDNVASLDVSLSSKGVGASVGITNRTGKKIDGGAGIGMQTSFNNTISMGDYSVSSSGYNYTLPIPTPVGIFSLSFGKQTYRYWASKNTENAISGPVYFNNSVQYKTTTYQVWVPRNSHEPELGSWGTRTITTDTKGFMDMTETPIVANELSTASNIVANNMTAPAYDSYNIHAQGFSGGMSSVLYENGALFGLSGKENSEGYKVNYATEITSGSGSVPDYAKFDTMPNFYLDNEISSYLNTNVSAASFNTQNTPSSILSYYDNGVETQAKSRRKTQNFVEYYTNNEINTNATALKQKGYLQPVGIGTERNAMPKDGIGAFKITTGDGKTYHYALPVYNHEIITRTFGMIPGREAESKSYFEKRQLEPFATHWLLTAVTGPDFVDNGDGVAGDGDLGYWTSFEYGKWTDAFIWKNPFKKDYIVDEKNPNIKTWISGRKQLYYLDKIKTRTHTALFIKSERTDSPSETWAYNSVNHREGANSDNNPYTNQFIVPKQNQLKLDKIILLKNTDETSDKTYGTDATQSVRIGYPNSEKSNLYINYNNYDNVLDSNDNWRALLPKAVKVIDFSYDDSLVAGDNRLTLKNVNFRGKAGTTVLPPYQFDYINDAYFDIDNKDGWGYVLKKPEAFSLNKITTPEGATINIGYETNKALSVTKHRVEFNKSDTSYLVDNIAIEDGTKLAFDIQSPNDLSIKVGDKLKMIANRSYTRCDRNIGSGDRCVWVNERETLYTGDAVVTQVYGYKNKVRIKAIDNINSSSSAISEFNISATYELGTTPIVGGGPRVASIKVSDGINSFYTDYKYGENENGVGYVSYVPFSQNVAKELPYSAELPAPRVMYEYVTMSTHGEGLPAEGKMRYKFNVMKSKEADKMKYGDFYEIVENKQTASANGNADVSISNFTIKDNLAAIGQLLEVSTFNTQGLLLSKINNNYYAMDNIPDNMGVAQESYQSYKTIDYTDVAKKDKWIINSSTRIKYPNIMKSSTELKNGYSYTSEFLDYDLISGIAKETRSVSSDGQSLRTRILPAYLKYPGMGSKVDNVNNANMLSQTAAEYSYILDKASNTWKETGVGITTWNNVWIYKSIDGTTIQTKPIWRKHKTFVWNGIKDANGIFLNYNNTNNDDDGFDWNLGVGTKWKQVSEITLYNAYSSPLEIKDINGNFAATKMGDNDTKIMTTGNAAYNEMYYTGAEYRTSEWLEPGIKISTASRSTDVAHTGAYSVLTNPYSDFDVLMGGAKIGKYKLSVWVEKNNEAFASLRLNGTTIPFTESIPAGNWVLKTAILNITAPYYNYSSNTIKLRSGNLNKTVYYDDLMIRPLASSISGYVYNEWDELTAIIGNNGLATKYEYDKAGRLIKTYTEVVDDLDNGITGGFKLINSNTYNNRWLKTDTYYNTAISRTFTKNNCATNYVGSAYTYRVPAKKYSSTVSPAAAEQMALDEINANGQTAANTNGTCTYVNPNPNPGPGPGQNCFIAGTKISMADGTNKNIEKVKVGEKVWTYDIAKQKITAGVVKEVTVTEHTKLVTITFDNSRSNTNTPDHPYYVKGKGWCSFNPEKTKSNYGLTAAKLEVGDVVFYLSNNKLTTSTVQKITAINKQQKTYNLHKVSKNHNYFANGILVHNKSR